MNSLYFLALLIGIAWLAIWSALPRPWQGGGWWPFDMREPDDGSRAETPRARAAVPPRPRGAPPRGRG